MFLNISVHTEHPSASMLYQPRCKLDTWWIRYWCITAGSISRVYVQARSASRLKPIRTLCSYPRYLPRYYGRCRWPDLYLYLGQVSKRMRLYVLNSSTLTWSCPIDIHPISILRYSQFHLTWTDYKEKHEESILVLVTKIG